MHWSARCASSSSWGGVVSAALDQEPVADFEQVGLIATHLSLRVPPAGAAAEAERLRLAAIARSMSNESGPQATDVGGLFGLRLALRSDAPSVEAADSSLLESLPLEVIHDLIDAGIRVDADALGDQRRTDRWYVIAPTFPAGVPDEQVVPLRPRREHVRRGMLDGDFSVLSNLQSDDAELCGLSALAVGDTSAVADLTRRIIPKATTSIVVVASWHSLTRSQPE